MPCQKCFEILVSISYGVGKERLLVFTYVRLMYLLAHLWSSCCVRYNKQHKNNNQNQRRWISYLGCPRCHTVAFRAYISGSSFAVSDSVHWIASAFLRRWRSAIPILRKPIPLQDFSPPRHICHQANNSLSFREVVYKRLLQTDDLGELVFSSWSQSVRENPRQITCMISVASGTALYT